MVSKQIEFTYCVGKLIEFATSRGYGLTFGDAWDRDRDGGHMTHSVHYVRLAVDFNLFVKDEQGDWTYVANGKDPNWLTLGLFWENISEHARWGGRFKSVDSNHFSFENEGYA